MFGYDGDLDLAAADEKDRIGNVSLTENLLIFSVPLDRLSSSGSAKKSQRIEIFRALNLWGVGQSAAPSWAGAQYSQSPELGRGLSGDVPHMVIRRHKYRTSAQILIST